MFLSQAFASSVSSTARQAISSSRKQPGSLPALQGLFKHHLSMEFLDHPVFIYLYIVVAVQSPSRVVRLLHFGCAGSSLWALKLSCLWASQILVRPGVEPESIHWKVDS